MILKCAVKVLINDLRNYMYPNLFTNQIVKKEKIIAELDCMLKKLEVKNYTATSYLNALDGIKDILKQDLNATYKGDPAATCLDEIIVSYPGFFALCVNRLAHELYIHNVPLLPRMMSEIAHSKTGIDIHPGASIGPSFFIDHGTGVVIGETTIIGKNVRVYQGVTLGALSIENADTLRNVKRHPTIKDNVIIYANASILGGNTIIGNNVVVGGNVFITQSVEDNKIVRLESKNYSIRDNK